MKKLVCLVTCLLFLCPFICKADGDKCSELNGVTIDAGDVRAPTKVSNNSACCILCMAYSGCQAAVVDGRMFCHLKNSTTVRSEPKGIVLLAPRHAVTVGDSYGGGTVFCVSQTPDITQCVTEGSGNDGLIMANEDQANYYSNPRHGVTWSSVYSGTGAQSDDSGATNTAAIIAALPQDNPSNNAGWLCHDYVDPREGHKDWYLPAKNELNKMYAYASANNLIGKGCSGSKAGGVQCLIGGYSEAYEIYWSSTEYPGYSYYSGAWSQYFRGGKQDYGGKIRDYFGARAVRAFINSTI